MDTTYLKENGIRLIAGTAISLFCMLAYGLGWFQPIYSAGNYIFQPIAYWGASVISGIQHAGETVMDIGNLSRENAQMQADIAQLKAQLGVYQEVKEENEILRSQLGVPLTQEWTISEARILGIDTYGVAEYVIIDLGSDDKVEVGDAVILGDVLIGEVRDVYGSTSKVRLVSNAESNIYSIDRNTNAKGLVRGSIQGVVMEEILGSETVTDGDVVITWEDEIPGNLVIGSVTRVEEVPTSSTKKAYIEPGYSLEDVQYVFVVLDF